MPDLHVKPSRIIGVGFLVVGSILLYFGLRATDSIGGSIREGLTGRFSDKTTWCVAGGAVITVVGAGMAVISSVRVAFDELGPPVMDGSNAFVTTRGP